MSPIRRDFFSFSLCYKLQLDQNKRMATRQKPKAKLFVIIGIAVGVITLSIVAGVLGKKAGKADCDCIKPSDAGWRGFSIAWFILSILGVIAIIAFGFKQAGIGTFMQPLTQVFGG